MGGKSGSSTPETVTQRVEIPSFIRPLAGFQGAIAQRALGDLAGQTTFTPATSNSDNDGKFGELFGDRGGGGQQTASSGRGLLFGDTLAGFTPQQQTALGLAEQRALGAGGFLPTFQNELLTTARGRDLSGVGVDQLRQTASGQAIDAPGFQSAFESSLRRAQPQIKGAFTLAGRSGGGLESVAQTQAAADSFANLFGQERTRQLGAAGTLADLQNAERQRQLLATSQLPGAALTDVGILQDVGAQLQAQRQREIEAPIAARERLLGLAGGPLGLNAFLGQSTTSPLHQNTGAGILGGAATGAGLASTIGGAASSGSALAALGGPWGLLGGAALGALLGGG